MTGKIKPIESSHDKFDYFMKVYCCPTCGTALCSYTYGRPWTDNRLSKEKKRDCFTCGQKIDWEGVDNAAD